MQKIGILILFLPSIIFFIALCIALVVAQGVKKETEDMVLPKPVFTHFSPSQYPILQNSIIANSSLMNSISAQGAAIMDKDSKVILFAKNPKTIFSMASTTKIMSALVGMEHYKLTDVLTIQSTNVPPAVVGYQVGEKVSFLDILYGMMLPSGNDAALAIAQNYPGGEQAFIRQMNQKAQALFLPNTYFADSSGLDNGNYTNVIELVRLAAHAMDNVLLAQIVNTKERETSNMEQTKTYTVTNLNQLLGKYGVNGIKTGFTPDAGGILVTSTVQDGHSLLIAVMKSNDRFQDTEKLLTLIGGNITYLTIAP